MRLDPLPLGPWPQGQDTYHDATHAVFQPGEQRLARLLNAVNVDLDDEGWSTLRAGLTRLASLSSPLSLFAGAGLLLAQDGGTLYKVNTSTGALASLVSGLSSSARISYHEHNGQVFLTNGIVTYRITSAGTLTNWGCTMAPTPTLGTTSGDLAAGIYQVAATFVDGNGIEHAASKAATVTLDGTKDITATLSAVDSNAATIRFYATRKNGTTLFFCKEVAYDAIPATISDVEVSEEPLRTQFLSPPIPGDGIFTYRGFLMIYADQYIFPSFGANVHLYEIADVIEARPENVLAGTGLDTGFWTVTSKGAYWTQGAKPEEWQTWKRDDREYCAGSLVIPGYYIPALQISESVALFVSEDGLMAGLPDGRVRPLTFERLPLSVTSKRASIIVRKTGDLRQILFSLV